MDGPLPPLAPFPPPPTDGVAVAKPFGVPVPDRPLTEPMEGSANGAEAAACTVPAARPMVSTCVALRANTIDCGDENGIGPTPWLGRLSTGMALRMLDSTGSVEPL